jgi:peptidoglycan/LPS O-acetylase OafA/YrhL
MSKEYNQTLDSLRGISILWVLLHHIPLGLPRALEFIRERGDLGVELFFAISGILVTKSIVGTFKKDQSNMASIKEYFVKRASRIFPPFYLTLAVLFVLAFLIPSLGSKLSSISDILFSFPTYLYNYAKFFTDGTVPGSFGIFWSLCFEEQFYLLLLLVFITFKKEHFNFVFITLILASIATRVYFSITPDQYTYNKLQYYTHYRLDAILLGSLAVINLERIRSFITKSSAITILSLIILVIGVCNHSYSGELNRALNYILVSLGFTGISIVAFINSPTDKVLNTIKKLLNNRLFTATGVISYEIYLTHQIFNGILAKSPLKSNVFAYSAVFFIASFVGAYLLHKFFSAPMNIFIRSKMLKQKFKTHQNSNVLVAEE